MAYLDKIYVTYDGNNDIGYYKKMKSWEQSDGSGFNFYDGYDLSKELDKTQDEILKAKILERIIESEVFVLLITKFTKRYMRFIRWQIEAAMQAKLPIIAINVNSIRSVDYDRCPKVLKKWLSIHISYQAPILEYALDNWPNSHYQHLLKENNETYKYTQDVYDKLKLETSEV